MDEWFERSPVAGFAPWIIYWVVAEGPSTWLFGALCAVLSALILGVSMGFGRPRLLEIVTVVFFALFLRKIWEARRRPASAGSETLVGATGEAREELAPEGLVFVNGALWRAVASNGPIPSGSPVEVVGRNGLKLEVVAGKAPGREDAELLPHALTQTRHHDH